MRILPAAVLALLSLAPRLPPQEGELADRLLQVLEKRHRETPDPTDARAAAGRLGFDRARILEFVAGMDWEPYSGILRGAPGTLLCRGGNSLDRALLLQAMLEAGGEKTRLMRAEVAEADASRLQDEVGKRKGVPRPPVQPETLAKELGLETGPLELFVTEQRREEQVLVDEVAAAAAEEATRLQPLVGAIPGRWAAPPREHFWIQALDKGNWIDLDPSPVELPRKGARPFTSQEVAAQRRTVTIRLVLNRKSGAKSEPVPILNVPSDLLAVSWKAVDLVLQPLPRELPPGAKLREMDAKARLAAFRQAKTYRGGLIIDGTYFGGIPFDLTGKLYDVDAGGRVGPAKALAAGLGKAFGGAFGGDGQEAPASSLESVVLELGVKEPGVPEVVHKRTLFAAAKPGEKLAALPILRYSFLVDSAPLPQGERGRRELAAFGRNIPALRKLFKGDLAGVHFNQHVEVPSMLLRFADLRRRLVARLASPYVQDRPGICIETSQVFGDDEAGRLMLRRGIDIVENPLRMKSGDATLALGLAETALECLLVSRKWPGDSSLSAWTSIERARLAGGKPEVSDRGGRKEIRWSPAAHWSIDPSTGQCVGRVPSGAGQGMVEAAWENASAVCNYSDVVGLAAGAGSATNTAPKWAEDAADYFGKACGIVGGSWPRDMAADKVKEATKDLWPGAISALAGF